MDMETGHDLYSYIFTRSLVKFFISSRAMMLRLFLFFVPSCNHMVKIVNMVNDGGGELISKISKA